MTVDIPDDSGRRIFAIIDVDALEAAANQIEAQLLVEFSGLPPHEKHALTPGVMFTWNWNPGVPGEQKIVDLGVGTTSHRSFLCQWLTRLEGRREKPRETKDSLVWDLDSGYEVEVSKATGFVTRQRFTNQPNSNAELVLESLELKAPSDNAQFVAPEQAPEGAIVKSAEMAEQMSVQFRMRLRDYIWTQLPKSIDAKAVSWSERSPEQLTGVFHELYAPICSRNWAEYTKDMRAWIDSVAGKVASSLAKLEPDDESGVAQLIAGRAPARANLRGNIDEELQSLLQSIKPPTTVPTDFRLYDVFLECERSAIRVAYESQVKEPLLAYFTERIDAALAR